MEQWNQSSRHIHMYIEIKTNQKIKTKIIAIKKEKIIKKNIDIDIDRILEKGEEKNVK